VKSSSEDREQPLPGAFTLKSAVKRIINQNVSNWLHLQMGEEGHTLNGQQALQQGLRVSLVLPYIDFLSCNTIKVFPSSPFN
jgi:hypothetical protein